MRVPQVNERVKDGPAQALRAMFAGIGSLLSVTDKIRHKPTESVTVPETAGPEAAAPVPAPEAEPSGAAEPETQTPQAGTPETAQPEPDAAAATTPEMAEPEAAAEPAAEAPAGGAAQAPEAEEPAAEAPAPEAAEAPDAAVLPMPNYDDLSVASLRARLRNLSAEQLGQLIEYEKGHANRADVIAMFERRIAKLAAGA